MGGFSSVYLWPYLVDFPPPLKTPALAPVSAHRAVRLTRGSNVESIRVPALH